MKGSLNNAPRQTLRELIARHGPGLCSDSRRCEGLLRDLCGEHRREINILVGALRDAIFYCPHCSLENFYDGSSLKARGDDPGLCWSCATALRLPPRIRSGSSVPRLGNL